MTDKRRAKNEFGKVAVLMGGESAEREISLLSGNAVMDALKKASVDAVSVDAGSGVLHELEKLKIDNAFIILHGGKGEDGRLQAGLELIGIPYTGSGVLACALAMDKVRCKKIWMADGLNTPPFAVLDRNTNWTEVIRKLGTVCVKPVREGSSIGISRADNAEKLESAYYEAARFDAFVMAEKWVEGREFSVAILNEKALPAIELRTADGFYDFHAKYESHETGYICPPDLTPGKIVELEQIALKAYHSVGCRGWGRVDVMQQENGDFRLLEVNTVPGLTSHSLVPMAARAAGLDFIELVKNILRTSYLEGSHGGEKKN